MANTSKPKLIMLLELPLSVDGISHIFTVESFNERLGDGYDQLGLPCSRIVSESWELRTIAIPTNDKNSILNVLRVSRGEKILEWRLSPDYPLQNFFCDRWQEIPVGEGYWQIALTLTLTNYWEVNECLIRESDLTTTHPTIPLVLHYGSSQSYDARYLGERIRGGVDTRASFGMNAVDNSWSVTAVLSPEETKEVLTFLGERCGNSFQFNLPGETGKVYNCKEWRVDHLGDGWWNFSATFKKNNQPFKPTIALEIENLFDYYGDRESVVNAIAASMPDQQIDQFLQESLEWLNRYTRQEYPLVMNPQYLIVNSFHTTLGRGGYFPPSAGPSEGQSVIARAACLAYQATGNTDWITLAVRTGDALLNNYFVVPIPQNWQPSDGIRVPHWLINIKEPFTSKGAASTTGDPLNMGHFDLVLNFVNGVSFIQHGSPDFGEFLANVYKVYDASDRLLWQNVYSPTVSTTPFPIDYWVTNVMLDGVISRQYGDSESPGGRAPTPTSEPPGKIVLSTPYTGQAKVVYSTYTGVVIGINQLFEPYPMWRPLRPGEALGAIDVFPWSADAFDLLYRLTNEQRFLNAYNCTVYSEAIAAEVINPSSWYKKDDTINPFSYPGSQVIPVPSTRTFTASRVTTGNKKDWIQINVSRDADPFPSIELQNFAVSIYMEDVSEVFVEAACNRPADLEIVLSLSDNPFDFSLYYIAHLLVPGSGIPTSKTFKPEEFFLWDKSKTSWHPYIAEQPVFVYSGSSGTAIATKIEDSPIGGIVTPVWQLTLDKNSDFAGGGLVMLGTPPRFPLKVYMKHEGTGEANLAVTVNGKKYRKKLEQSEWRSLTLTENDFEDSDEDSPPGSAVISGLEVEAVDGTTTTYFWWVSEEPNRLPVPVQTYKALVVSRIREEHILWVGNFEALNSPSSALKFSPGVVPFTANVVSDGQGGQVIDAWRGIPMTGYQYPAYYVKRGYWDRLSQVLDFMSESQEVYREQNVNKTTGPFAPGFGWEYWDAGEYVPEGINQWTWNAVDPNSQWEGYYCRPWESVCHAWYLLASGQYPRAAPSNIRSLTERAGLVSMRFAQWLSKLYSTRRSFQPPSDFPEFTDPEVNYHTPHFAAFALRASIYCNLAGGNPAVTLRLIKASYDYLVSQYIDSGSMKGSFAASQPTFQANGIEYREFFGFWEAEIIEAIALLKQSKNLFNYPKCVYFIKT
ncbi:MAG: phage tail protein [Moorea sp. SIO2B7]|nr:phage tail protein [Moorena sp. SIO2B7]